MESSNKQEDEDKTNNENTNEENKAEGGTYDDFEDCYRLSDEKDPQNSHEHVKTSINDEPIQVESMVSSSEIQCQEGGAKSKRRRRRREHLFESSISSERGGSSNGSQSPPLLNSPGAYHVVEGIAAPPTLQLGQERVEQGNSTTMSEGIQLTMDSDLNSLVPADSTPDAQYPEMFSSPQVLSEGSSPMAVVHAQVVEELPFEERFAAEIEARLQAEFQGIPTAEVAEEGLEGKDVASEAKCSVQQRKWRLCIVIGFAVGVAVISTFTVMRSQDSAGPTTSLTISPSPMPPPLAPTSQRYIDMRQVLLNISSEEDLDDESSPQFHALEWIVSLDGLQLDPVPSYDLYQRYIVVVLYFATKGETWSNGYKFLTNVSICDWNDGGYGIYAYGLFCYDSIEDLERVSLSYNELKGGPLPPEIGWLSSLVSFDVSTNDIGGAIPSTIGALTNLTHLDLSSNALTGSLPSKLQEMRNLLWFEVAYNSLTGQIPSLSGLSNLYTIDLADNQFLGTLSNLLGDFNGTSPSLGVLDLSNTMIGGTLPSSICSIINLKKLSLDSIFNLEGQIPSCFCNLTSLRWLSLSNTNLEGQLPSCMGSMVSLEKVLLGGNDFKGSIEQFACPSLVGQIETDTCYEDSCSCCCCIDTEDCPVYATSSPTTSSSPTSSPTATVPPTSVSDDSSLTYSAIREVLLNVTNSTVLDDPSSPQNKAMVWLIDDDPRQVPATNESALIQRYILAVIYFAMNGPQWTDNMNFLSERSICQWNSVNNDWGELWGCVCSGDGNKVVNSIYLRSINNLSFSIPPELGYLSSLESITLDSNYITGTIPTELGLLTNLRGLDITQFGLNGLDGPLPSELGSLTQLSYINLSNNVFTGTLPSELASLTQLQYLRLSYNALTGTLPRELFSLTQLEWLELSVNGFTGTLPSELGSLTQLYYLGLGGTPGAFALTGTLPSEVGNLSMLENLELGNNKFEGIIPSSLGNLTNLGTIFIDQNDFSQQDLDPIFCHLAKMNAVIIADCMSDLTCTCCICCDNNGVVCDDFEFY